MSVYSNRAWRGLVLGAALLALGTPAQAQGPRVDSEVRRALKEGKDLPVIVRFRDDRSLEAAKKLKSGKQEVKRAVKAMRALGIKANHRALRELLEHDGVLQISYDAPVKANLLGLISLPPPPPPPSVSVDGSGSKVARSRYGVNGAGVTVAVIDSGVRPHTDLPATRIKAFVDFVGGKTTPYDDYGHGTHVAGIVAGSGSASSGQYVGVAPSASIVALKVLDKDGMGTTSNVLAALEWVLANHTLYNIRVVNLSLGHPIYEPAATDPMVQLVEALSRKGIVVVVSAGNMGRNTLGQTVYGSVTSPANAQGAITVGAADTKYTLLRSDDSIASFSSRGPTRYDFFVKPDVVAPGYHVTSLSASGSTLLSKYPNLQIGSSYFRLNGTSQAAPVVAGTAALMLQANAGLTAHTVKGIIQFTAQRLRNIDVMSQGAGEVNVAGAVRMAKLIHPTQGYGKRWTKGSRKTIHADLLFGETAYWGRAILWGTEIKPSTSSMHLRLAQWDDNIVWGMLGDNIVWGMDENIVWGMLLDDNIVWGMLDNIVWGMNDNIVWGLTHDTVMAFSELLMGMSYEDPNAEGGVQ